MAIVRVAAVQASYVLMDQQATLDKVAELTGKAAGLGAQLVAFPEVFVPGEPIWIDTRPIWDGDEAWFRLLAENVVTVPGPATERLAALARDHVVWLVIGVEEREPHGGTIYNTLLYFSPDGVLAGRHRKLVPTGAERTVWGMGDGSMLQAVDTAFGRVGGLICWENYMPLARFYLYAQGVELWLAPTLAHGDGWIATMRHIARENRMFVVGVNPVLHIDQIPAGFPHRDRLIPGQYRDEHGDWISKGNTVIVAPSGQILAGPVRQREETLVADLDLGDVLAARRHLDPGRPLPPARHLPPAGRHIPPPAGHPNAPARRRASPDPAPRGRRRPGIASRQARRTPSSGACMPPPIRKPLRARTRNCARSP